jgi:hypothetical protein
MLISTDAPACRSCGDRPHQADVLLLQARLALLASQHEEAVTLAQVCVFVCDIV